MKVEIFCFPFDRPQYVGCFAKDRQDLYLTIPDDAYENGAENGYWPVAIRPNPDFDQQVLVNQFIV